MTVTTIAQESVTLVTVGIDTHRDTHVAVALDHLGRRLDRLDFATTQAGYDELVAWASALGQVEAFGIEGTGSYGKGVMRALLAQGYLVLEVTRPNRQARRRRAKSDPADAEAAARAVLAGEAAGLPKGGDGEAEVIRMLRVERNGAVKARTQAINAMRALIVSAPDELRGALRHLDKDDLVSTCARLRPGSGHDVMATAKCTLRGLARRCQHLDAEIAGLDSVLEELVAAVVPELVALVGFGIETAGQLLVTAGDNPERLRSEAAFSNLCGASPREASSGHTVRHRLSRTGDRQANAALYVVAIVRMRWHGATRDYVERRTKEGKTKREIIRCLKRYIARDAYAALMARQQRLEAALAC